MSYQRSLRMMNIVISYLLVFSLLSSPIYTGSSVNAAPGADKAQQAGGASVSLTKSDNLQVDQDGDGQVDAGDTLRYTITASNIGSVDASGVLLSDVLEGNLTLLPGSLRSTPLAYDGVVNAPEDSQPVPFTLNGVDFDGDTLSYTITTPPAHGTLAGTPPNLTYQPNTLNYFGSDSLVYQVCDATPTCSTATVAITIPSVNDAPTFTAGPAQSVLEDSGTTTVNGWATGMSAGPINEFGQTWNFLVSSDNPSLFAATPTVAADGTLQFTPAPNAHGQAVLSVALHDNGGTALGGSDTSAAQTVTVEVRPINDAPGFTVGANVTVDEDAGPQALANWAGGITPGPNEAGQSLTFEVTANTNPTLFQAPPSVSSTGTLTFQSAADTLGSAQITLRLVDDGGTANGGVDTSAQQSFNITVQSLNDTPQVTPATFDLPENSAVNTTVGTVTYTDPDQGQTHTFSITAGNTSNAFSIDPTSGVITVANPAALNFETTPVFHLTVTVTDNGTPIAAGSATVDVNLLNENDTPVVPPITFRLPENTTAGTSVGTVLINDPDNGQTHVFSIIGGNTGSAFAINNSGQLTVASPAALDFETNPTFTLTVQVIDNGDPAATATGTVTVELTNINEVSVVNSTSFSVSEYSPNGTVVGTVTYTDPDAGQTHAFAITAGNTDNAFAISSSGQITVANSSALRFSTNPSFSLTVSVSDNGSPVLTGTGTITINLGNVNDAPVVTPVTFAVNENTSTGTSVGPVTYTDVDTGQTHTFSIESGNTGSAFAIDPITGVITVAGPLNYEALPSYTLVVAVSDNGTPRQQGTANVTININNVNEAPTVGPASFNLPENSIAGTSVGTMTVVDPETSQTHTFAITGGNTGDTFAINSQGQITVANPALLDFESNPSFSLQIQVTDSGTEATVVTITLAVNLTDVNEAPSIADAAFAIDENTINGTLVGTLPVVEPDGGQSHTFTILSGNTGGAFAIDSDGRITVANSSALNFEVTPSFTLSVRVTDSGSAPLSDTAVVTVTVNDMNEAPVVQGESYQAIGNTMLQVAGTSTATAPFVFVNGNLLSNDSDPDSANSLHTELASASANAVVTITPAGAFTYVPPAGATSDSFTYRVVDQDGQSTTGTVTIEILSPVWYVKNDAAPNGTGRSTDPFDTLAEAQAASAVGDTIYVYYGDGTTAGQDAGIVLKNNQRLIGSGVALDVPVAVNGGSNPTALLPAGTQAASIANTTPGGSGVTIANGSAEVRGLNIAGAANAIDAAFSDTSVGTLNIQNNTMNAAGNGFNMIVTGGAAQLNFSNNSVTAGANGIWVDGSGGTLVMTGFANNQVSGDTALVAAAIDSAVFDAVPGGALDPINLGTFTAGSPTNPVGGSGLTMTNVQGSLRFTGLDITSTGRFGLQVTGAGTNPLSLSIDEGMGRVSVTGGTALSLASLTVNAPTLAFSSINSPFDGVRFESVNGLLTSTNDSVINNPQANAFYFSGGSARITYNGTINQAVGRTVYINQHTSESIIFNGPIVGGGTGVLLEDNASGQIAFNGDLTLNTIDNSAFTATDAGTLIVTAGNNNLTSTNRAALSVNNTTIGSEGLTFRSISAIGAPVGIELQNTGNQGGLTVTGTGTSGSGGTIQNTSDDAVRLTGTHNVTLNYINITNAATSITGPACGAEMATDCSSAVDMYNATNVTLNSLNLNGSGQMGISGYLVNGLTITSTSVLGAGNSNYEYALLLHNPSGTVLVENSNLTGMYDSGIRLYKYDSPLLNMILRSVIVSSNNAAAGEDGFQFKLINAQANMLVENSSFTQLRRDGIDGVYQGSSQLNLTVHSSNFTNNAGNGGIVLFGADNTRGFFTLNGNTIRNTNSTAISLTGQQFAEINAQVTGNLIEPLAPTTAISGEGIRLSQEENSQMTVQVSGNMISGVYLRDIYAYARQASAIGSLHLRATNNNAQAPVSNLAHGMDVSLLDAGHTVCLDAEQNIVNGNNAAGIRVRNQSGIFQIEGASGILNAGAAAALINSLNTSTPAAVATAGPGRSFTGVANGACRSAIGATLPFAAQNSTAQFVQQPAARAHGLARLLSPILQAAGETVQVNIGTLPAGKSVTVTFDVVVANPMPAGVFQVSNQAVLRGMNFTDVLSDDPTTTQVGDPTIRTLYSTPSAVDDLVTVTEDTPFTLAAPGVLANDLVASGHTLQVQSNTNPASGTLTVRTNGGFDYTPAQNVNGDVTFTYTVNDGERNSAPALVTLRIQPVNDAPVLDPSGSMRLTAVGAASSNGQGTLIRDLLSSAGDRISDVDAGAVEGIAITAADTTHGQWQYTIDRGLTWSDLGQPSDGAARLLASNDDTRLRFVSAPDYTGIVDPAITFRAWDRSSGTNGATADVTTNGGITAFSQASETASIEVYPVANLTLVKTASLNPALAGDTLVYTLKVTNQGPSIAQNVRITDTLPGSVTFASTSTGCTQASGVVTCDHASLNAGASVSFDVTVDIPTDFFGSLVNTATVTSQTEDSNKSDNTSSITTLVSRQVEIIGPDDPIDPGDWNNPIIEQPDCGETFMGEFSNETVTLNLDQLPRHTLVTLEFDLVIIRSWDGNQVSNGTLPAAAQQSLAALGAEIVGPDVWSLSADGQPLLTTTFSNWDAYGFHQAYPGPFPGGDFPARTGSKSVNNRCYIYAGYSQDTVYHMRYDIPHNASSMKIDFTASGLQTIEDESWGLDNISVRVSSGTEVPQFMLYLPIIRR